LETGWSSMDQDHFNREALVTSRKAVNLCIIHHCYRMKLSMDLETRAHLGHNLFPKDPFQ
jgi:hypothetical protein